MKTRTKIVALLAVCVILAVVVIFAVDIGVSRNDIESDARKSQRISSAWSVSKSTNDKMCAMIFYDETLEDHVFSVYLNHDGLSFGYFFSIGGSDVLIDKGIHEFDQGEYGCAILSMNTDRVAKVEIDNGIESKQIELDPARPFAVTIPANSGAAVLYDENGRIVRYQ